MRSQCEIVAWFENVAGCFLKLHPHLESRLPLTCPQTSIFANVRQDKRRSEGTGWQREDDESRFEESDVNVSTSMRHYLHQKQGRS